MDNPFSKTIVFNPDMTLKERYERCIYIIGKYRSELPYLRRKLSTIDKQNKKAYEEMLYWRKKYEEEKGKNKKLDREVENFQLFERKRIFAKRCGRCNRPLKRANATKQKILLDIIINPQIIKMILESERQWCKTCKVEV